MTTEDLAKEHTVTYQPVVISLPISDRRTSYDFYRQALSLAPLGELDETSIPEPLQFAVNVGTRIMLIPRGGFERATGGGPAALPGHRECFLAINTATQADTGALVQRAVAAGAGLVLPPGHSHGDTWARSPTPTGTCGWCGPAINTPRDACLLAGAATQNAATVAGGTVMAGTATPVLAVTADTSGAAAELQAALARRFGADYQVVASASAAAALAALVLADQAAATYAACEGLRTLLLEPRAAEGQAGTTSLIRNYLGFPRRISGRELALRPSSRRSCSVPT